MGHENPYSDFRRLLQLYRWLQIDWNTVWSYVRGKRRRTTRDLGSELVSEDWENILEKMLAYKKEHYPADSRVITVCGYTPWKTFRVEWE